MSDDAPVLERLPDIDEDDFTVYVPAKQAKGCAPGDFAVRLRPSGQEARVLVCHCRDKKYFSITVRRIGPRREGALGKLTPFALTKSGYWSPPPRDPNPKSPYVNSIAELCELIYRKARLRNQGLVVVAGATNSCKSNIARGLVHQHIRDCCARRVEGARDRKPHLVTVEDPIEAVFLRKLTRIPGAAPFLYYGAADYTPRHSPDDLSGKKPTHLESAIDDALRQTPALFYVGESRNREDLAALLDFAQTGHLVITTTHAGSLTDTIGKLLMAAGATTPARRSVVAQTLVAVVHLVRIVVKRKIMIVPTIWRSTPAGQMTLTSDGLSSVVPHQDNAMSTLGRMWFAKQLRAPVLIARDVLRYAAHFDLEGV